MLLKLFLLLFITTHICTSLGLHERGPNGFRTYLRPNAGFGEGIKDWFRNAKQRVSKWWMSIVTPWRDTDSRVDDTEPGARHGCNSDTCNYLPPGTTTPRPTDVSTTSTTAFTKNGITVTTTSSIFSTTLGSAVSDGLITTPVIPNTSTYATMGQITISTISPTISAASSNEPLTATTNEGTTINSLVSSTTSTVLSNEPGMQTTDAHAATDQVTTTSSVPLTTSMLVGSTTVTTASPGIEQTIATSIPSTLTTSKPMVSYSKTHTTESNDMDSSTLSTTPITNTSPIGTVPNEPDSDFASTTAPTTESIENSSGTTIRTTTFLPTINTEQPPEINITEPSDMQNFSDETIFPFSTRKSMENESSSTFSTTPSSTFSNAVKNSTVTLTTLGAKRTETQSTTSTTGTFSEEYGGKTNSSQSISAESLSSKNPITGESRNFISESQFSTTVQPTDTTVRVGSTIPDKDPEENVVPRRDNSAEVFMPS